MSIRLLTRALDECQELEGSKALAFIGLCDFANDDGLCFPGFSAIARRARVSPRQAKRIVKELKEGGYVEIVEKGGGGKQTVYKLHFPTSVTHDTGDIDDTGDTDDTGVTHVTGDILACVTGERNHKKKGTNVPQKNVCVERESFFPSGNSKATASPIDPEQVREAYNRLCPSCPPCTKLTAERRRVIAARAKEYAEPMEAFEAVFEAFEDSDFYSGRSGNFSQGLDWLLKPQNFLKVYEEALRQPPPKPPAETEKENKATDDDFDDWKGGRS